VFSPPLLVVAHATAQPGIDNLVAGALAEAITAGPRLTVLRLAPGGVGIAGSGCAEHVTAGGSLQPNGMVWLERAAGRVEVLERPPEAELTSPTVISANPSMLDAAQVEALRRWAGNRGAVWATVRDDAAGFDVYLGPPSDDRRLVARRIARDAYGRLAPIDAADFAPEIAHVFGDLVKHASLATSSADGPRPRIVVVGQNAHLTDVYPAVLASLGDAADQLGMAPILLCVSHQDAFTWTDLLTEADGLVLPGGSDMSQTEGQIAAAAAALDQDLPALGLCLGMQTMTTAFLRRVCGFVEAHLEETRPEAPTLSFIRLHDGGAPQHYLGEYEISVRPDTRLAALYRRGRVTERLNHRYHLNPALMPILQQRGLRVTANTVDTDVAEGVEVLARRFYLGIQGHPELTSRRGAPHPAIAGFLQAAAKAGERPVKFNT